MGMFSYPSKVMARTGEPSRPVNFKGRTTKRNVSFMGPEIPSPYCVFNPKAMKRIAPTMNTMPLMKP